MNTQQEIFDSIQHLATKIGMLNSFVQNDFNQLKESSWVTKPIMQESSRQAENLFNEAIGELIELRDKTTNCIKEFANTL